MNIKTITIVGGGSAGWLSAIFFKSIVPKIKVQVIESEDIDILGAGEGGVPIIFPFFRQCDIDINEFIKQCNGTIKLGVKFENWCDNDYFHSFAGDFIKVSEIEWPDKTDDEISSDDYDENHIYEIDKSIEKQQTTHFLKRMFYNLAYQNESNFYDITSPFEKDGIPDKDLQSIANWTSEQGMTGISFHFDARLMVDYLKYLGKQRGIEVINDEIVDVVHDHTGKILTLISEKNQYDVDFCFDCTGESSTLMRRFDDFKYWNFDYLTLNRALPFNLENGKDIDMWTKSIALKNGWMWQIPLQNRVGCGYVFDGNYLSFGEAQLEVEEYLGLEIEPLKRIMFEPGYIDKSWNNNCIALGMSQSFLEPLEATALGDVVVQLTYIQRCWQKLNDLYTEQSLDLSTLDELIWDDDDEMVTRLEYNATNNNLIREIADFIHMHYFTNKDDSEFWKTRKENFIYDGVKFDEEWDGIGETTSYKLHTWQYMPVYYEPEYSFLKIFNEFNLLSIIDGLNIYDKAQRDQYIQQEYDGFGNVYEQLKSFVTESKAQLNFNTLSQKDYLKKYGLVAKA